MPLVPTKEPVLAAAARHTGIGAFNLIHLETAEALVSAAERADAPVILQISQNCVAYHGGLEAIARAALAAAHASSAHVAVHLDHAEDEKLARQAVDLGFGSVMFDGSALDYEANVAATVRVVEYAHANDAFVEAELGAIGGKDGAHAPGVRTDPLEARRFADETGVDALAVAVGSSHAMTARTAAIDLDLVSRIHAAVHVPLVLHGSSGVPDETIVEAIRAGMTKINVSTHLNGFFTDAVRSYLAANPEVVDSRKYVGAGREALAAEAARLITVFSSGARAGETEGATP